MAFLFNFFRGVFSRIVNVGFHEVISCQIGLKHRCQSFCRWKVFFKLWYRVHYIIRYKHGRLGLISKGFLDLIGESILIDTLAKPIIWCLMYFEANLGFKGSYIVGSRAHFCLPINYILFGWVEDLPNDFEFLLVTDLVYFGACLLVLDFRRLGVLLFLKAWCVVMVITYAWSLLVWILVFESRNMIVKWMGLRNWLFYFQFIHSWTWNMFWFLQFSFKKLMTLKFAT